MQHISDDILRKAGEGDMEAFKQIYEAISGFVYSIALRVTRNKEDAEDVTQDVFLKIYDNLKNFKFKSSFKTWVYRITANSAINASKKRAKHIEKRDDFELTIQKEAAPVQNNANINAKDNQQILTKVLGLLNPDHRACILLREIEGLSYEEIANSLNININTVRSRLKRARSALLFFAQKEAV
jgi:RNA polymerase sigma-70 factor, ECF subfamily